MASNFFLRHRSFFVRWLLVSLSFLEAIYLFRAVAVSNHILILEIALLLGLFNGGISFFCTQLHYPLVKKGITTFLFNALILFMFSKACSGFLMESSSTAIWLSFLINILVFCNGHLLKLQGYSAPLRMTKPKKPKMKQANARVIEPKNGNGSW